MNLFEYYTQHVFPRGIHTFLSAFRIWKDLMMSNYKDYTLLKDDDPFEECKSWFWATLCEDDVLPKEFLEYLYELSDQVDRGEVEAQLITTDMMNELKELVGDMIKDD